MPSQVQYLRAGFAVLVSKLQEAKKVLFRKTEVYHDPHDHLRWITPVNTQPINSRSHFVRLFVQNKNPNGKAFHTGVAGRRSRTALGQKLYDEQCRVVANLHRACLAAANDPLTKARKRRNPPFSDWQTYVVLLEKRPGKLNKRYKARIDKIRTPDPKNDSAPGEYKYPDKQALKQETVGVMLRHGLDLEKANPRNSMPPPSIRSCLRLFVMIWKARVVEHHQAHGLRGLGHKQRKGKIPTSATAQDLLLGSSIFQKTYDLSLVKMVDLAIAIDINPAKIWPKRHGDPDIFDFYRLFELARASGNSRCNPNGLLSEELALFLARELLCIVPGRQAKMQMPQSHPAILAIAEAFDHSVGFHAVISQALAQIDQHKITVL